jgi:hypothetical protein
MTRHLAAFLFGALVSALLLATTANAADECERMKRRYDRACATPTPTPGIPSPTKSTPEPLPCEPVGTKHYAPGQEIMMCFVTTSSSPYLVEVSVENEGDTSCGELEAELRSPTGARHYSYGPQPNTVLPRVPGKYYLWTRLSWGCNAYTFRVR